MAHLAAAWPEQTLCKENKRKAIVEQQRKWMEQRDAALQQIAAPTSCGSDADDDLDGLEELDGINSFLASVGESLAADSPSTGHAADAFADHATMRRDGSGLAALSLPEADCLEYIDPAELGSALAAKLTRPSRTRQLETHDASCTTRIGTAAGTAPSVACTSASRATAHAAVTRSGAPLSTRSGSPARRVLVRATSGSRVTRERAAPSVSPPVTETGRSRAEGKDVR
jgi:hypothetical protein